jgi:hypothetical protein
MVRAIEATLLGDATSVSDLFTEDVVAWSPTVAVASRVELAVEMEDHDDAFSEVEVQTSPVVADGDRLCAEWVATAMHSVQIAALDGGPDDPGARRIMVRGVTVADFDGGRIRAVRHYWNEVELLQELGLAHRI